MLGLPLYREKFCLISDMFLHWFVLKALPASICKALIERVGLYVRLGCKVKRQLLHSNVASFGESCLMML